jgi:hypothetical protein
MNYQASCNSVATQMSLQVVPIGADWKRVNFALAGYGHVLAGTISEPVPAETTISSEATATLTITLRGD